MNANLLKHRFYLTLFSMTLLVLQSSAEEWPFSLNCPKDVTVSCHDEIWNLSIYGNATITEGYKTYSAGTPVVKYFLNSCNSGYITRTWMVEDNMWRWHSCTQTIYVSPGSASGPYITWPQDIELTGCNPQTSPNQLPPGYNYPEWDNTGCGMYGKSYSDMLFTVNSQCKKIMRTWKVMDWCTTTSSYSNTFYKHVQFIYIVNNIPPVVNCPANITIESINCQNAYLTTNSLTLAPGTCGGEFEITNNSPYATSKGNNISGTYPIGTTKVSYSIRYGCGKTFYCNTNVTVLNGAKPVPYCLGEIVTALMGVDTDKDGKFDNGMVEIWAKDLNKGSHSKCGNHPLKFSFSKNVNETYRIFTCDHIGKNNVEIWVTDSEGAQTFCMTEINVQNNGANIPNCKPKTATPPPTPVAPIVTSRRLNGTVTTITDKPLEQVDVKLEYKDAIITYTSKFDTIETLLLDSFINASGYKLYRYTYGKKINEKRDTNTSFITRSVKTIVDGKFKFDTSALANKSAFVSATYSDSTHSHIDQKDVLLLQKFLAGEITFSSYQQYLASDIDENGRIDETDLQALTDLVEKRIAGLPGSFQWFLLDTKAAYPNPSDVLKGSLPLKISLDSITSTTPDVNFVAIKKGNISVDQGSIKEDLQTESRIQPVKDLIAVFNPNPYNDKVILSISHPQGGAGILSMLDMNGRELYKNTINIDLGSFESIIDLSELPSGMLFYKVVLRDQVASGKLIHLK
ncbi:MAG: T9SS type A sorting domain-containing protein [Saprospiraceae bacterium]|nr:T9SS type A sorting domain-containing protein [Saprospiraceae bacterium]